MRQYVLKPLNNTPVNSLPEDFDSSLNPSQRAAVYHDDGPLLVIAGAGSGKTKTLVYRVARLVCEGVAPESILLLTFTRKSAHEMLKRAALVLDSRCQDVSGGTFHSFSHMIMRRYGSHIGYDEGFTILDRADSEDLISMIRKELGFQKVDKRFPKKGSIASIIGKAINTNRSIGDVIESDYSQFVEFSNEIQTISKMYHEQKKVMQVVDYDDLLVQLLRLLKTVPEVRERLQQAYRYILVDEFQDTNHIQAEILKYLVNAQSNIMVVGDDSQSIYSFRGADFKNIMEFPDHFPGATVVKLEENYRSTQPILDMTNAIIGQAKERYTKSLFTERESQIKPVYVETDNDNHQSRFVVQKILELREGGIPLSEIAVLIRSGWHSNDLEVELQSANIPFVKFGGFKFMETAHVKDVLSFLKLMANPLDTVSWNRLLLMLDGVGAKGAQGIIQKLLSDRVREPFFSIQAFRKKPYFQALNALCEVIFSYKGKTPMTLIDDVMVYYTPIFQHKYDDYPKRTSDLDSLKAIAERFDKVDDFLAEMTLEPPDASQASAEPESSDDESMTISTIHSAKGLEWSAVFLISAVDGYLPSFQSLGDAAQIEEERRLMYVALTRAKDQLFIVKPNLDGAMQYARYSGMTFSTVSRFLGEADILDRFSEKWVLVEERKSSPFSSFYDSQYDTDDGFIDGASSGRKYSF